MKKFFFIFAVAVLAISLTSCTPEVTDVNPFTATKIGGGDSSSGGGGAVLSSSSSSLGVQTSSSSLRSSSSAPAVLPSSSSSPPPSGGKGNDIANYRTVKIGDQTWMAENLDYAVEGSKCPARQDSFCNTYGRLYNWVTAMDLPASCETTSCTSQINEKHKGICPAGWHVPTKDEWDVLANSIGGSSTAGKHLKATSGWYNNGNGLDTYGFAALPGGFVTSSGGFGHISDIGYWWSASETRDYSSSCMKMSDDREGAYYDDYHSKSNLISVRCVQD